MKIEVIIGLLLIVVGYTMGYILPPTHFLPTLEIEISDNEVDNELIKGIGFVNESITFIEQKQYGKARGMIGNAKESSDAVLKYTNPYEDGRDYLDALISCIDDLAHTMELSDTNNNVEVIEYANKFLADFSNLSAANGTLTVKHPDIAEKLNTKETMLNLRHLEYDMIDLIQEYEKNETALLLPISFEGHLKEFKWKDHLGKECNFKIKISERRYEKYVNNTSHEMKEDEDIFKFVTDEDAQIREIAQWFNNSTYPDREDEANCILSFVQECVPTVSDGRAECFKYPIETLIYGGDCEDKSILFLSIMKAEGYDVAFASYPQHWMGGVVLSGGIKRVKDPYFGIPIEGEQRYFLCETLDDFDEGFKIGAIPEEFKKISPLILVIPN